MAIWNRNDDNYNRGNDGMNRPVREGLDRVQDAFRGHNVHDVNNRYDAGYRGADRGGMDQGMRTNSWADGAYTADAADRLDRDTDLGGNRGRGTSPFHGGWNGGDQSQGGYNASGMNRGMPNGMDRNGRGWNLGGRDEEWGHNWGAGGANRGMHGQQGGMHEQHGGGFLNRAQNAVRRGWEQVEDRFDGDDDRTLAYGARPTAGRGSYDRDMQAGRGGYDRDMQGGRGMMGGATRGRMSYDNDFNHRDGGHGYKTRQQTDAGDPFGDRQARTPIRMVNGGYDDRYDNDRGTRGGVMGGGMMGGAMGRDYDHDGDVDMGDRLHGAADRMSAGARRGWNNVRERFDGDDHNRVNRGYDRDTRGWNGGRDWF